MRDLKETARKLLVLALHEGTPKGEREAAAIQCCRLVEQLGLLREGISRSVSAPVVVEAVDRVVSDDGTVLVGAAKYCRECVAKLVPRRGPGSRVAASSKIIKKWERAVKHGDGSYSHVQCARGDT